MMKYKKNKDVDEFGTSECVICMEEFKNGTEIRKIPSCRHIFHSECIMKWLSGTNQMDQQRCPMCNEEITVQILEHAIQEESAKKRGIRRDDRNSSSMSRHPPPNHSNQGEHLDITEF